MASEGQMSQLNHLTLSWQDKELICNPKAEVGIVELGLQNRADWGSFSLQEGKEQRKVSKSTAVKNLRVFISETKTP